MAKLALKIILCFLFFSLYGQAQLSNQTTGTKPIRVEVRRVDSPKNSGYKSLTINRMHSDQWCLLTAMLTIFCSTKELA